MHSDLKKANVQRRDHANFAPNSREKIANFRKNFGAPRAEKLRELGQRCCANQRISLHLFIESERILLQGKVRVQRRYHAKFAQKSGEKFAKIPEIRHAPRQKNCVHSAIVRCAHCTMSLRVDRVRVAFRSKKIKRLASGSRKFCAQLPRKNCKVPENFRRAARTNVS